MTNHTNHNHAATPAARARCRKAWFGHQLSAIIAGVGRIDLDAVIMLRDQARTAGRVWLANELSYWINLPTDDMDVIEGIRDDCLRGGW